MLGMSGTHDDSVSLGGFDTIKTKSNVLRFHIVFSVLYIFLPFIAKQQRQFDPIVDNIKTQRLTFCCINVLLNIGTLNVHELF